MKRLWYISLVLLLVGLVACGKIADGLESNMETDGDSTETIDETIYIEKDKDPITLSPGKTREIMEGVYDLHIEGQGNLTIYNEDGLVLLDDNFIDDSYFHIYLKPNYDLEFENLSLTAYGGVKPGDVLHSGYWQEGIDFDSGVYYIEASDIYGTDPFVASFLDGKLINILYYSQSDTNKKEFKLGPGENLVVMGINKLKLYKKQ